MIDIDAPLFASLPAPALERVRGAVEVRRFAPGDVILNEGETRGELFVITHGEAVVSSRNWHGEPVQLARLEPGDCFGELSMLSGEPASATVAAASDAEVWALAHADFVAIAEEHPELARNLSTLLGDRIRKSNERQLRAQRGKLISLVAIDAAPWAFWLAYRLAASVAMHARQQVVLLDASGHASERIAGRVRVLSFGSGAPFDIPHSSSDNHQPNELLSVVSLDNREGAPSERQLAAALDKLLDHVGFVLTFAAEQSPVEDIASRRAGSVLVLTRDPLSAGTRTHDGRSSLVVLDDQEAAPLVGAARGAPPWTIRGVVPGGPAVLEMEPLPSVTGDAVGRLARSIAGLTVGIALGGGGAKGYAHIGIVGVLQRAGVPIDCVAGCSIGAPLAAGLAAGWPLDEIRSGLDKVSQKAIRPNVPLISILSSRSVRAELRSITEETRFAELPTPLGIVAVDIETGEEVLLRSGRVWPALLASMAYPGIYEPVRLGKRYLVDGGVLDPVPVRACVALGADVVISANLSGSVAERIASKSRPESQPMRRRLLLDNIARTLEIMQAKIVEESCHRADVMIRPTFTRSVGLLDFKRGPEVEEAGAAAAEREMARVRTVLPWLS